MNAREKVRVAAEEAKRRLRDIAGMKDDGEWPNWPFLPLVKRDGSHECGLLIADQGPVVFKANMWGLKGVDLSALPQERFDNYEALYEAGWRVD